MKNKTKKDLSKAEFAAVLASANLIKECSHIAVVIDHSLESDQVRKLTAQAFDDLDDVMERFKQPYEFVVVVRGKDTSDKGTLMCLNLEALEQQAITQVIEKVAGIGGKCGFILAVAPALVPRLTTIIEFGNVANSN